MLTRSCRVQNKMAPTASWAASNGSPATLVTMTTTPANLISFAQPKPKRVPVSILKKAESDTSSTCSNSSMITCVKGCKLKVLNTQINTHDCFERMRQELNDSYGKIDDLEEQLRLQREGHREKEHVLRNQIKRLRGELGIGGLLDVGEKICLTLTRENRTFGFKLLGRVEGDEISEEDGESGVSIASLTHCAPALKSGKIFIRDKILEINSQDVTSSTCSEVETLIRNSPDTMNLVLIRTNMSKPYTPPTPTTPTNPTSSSFTTPTNPSPRPSSRTNQQNTPLYSTPKLPTSLTYQPVAPPRTTSQPHPHSQSHPQPHPQPYPQSQPHPHSPAQSQSHSQSHLHSQSHPQPHPQPYPQSQPHPHSQPHSQSHPQSPPQSHSQSQLHSHSQTLPLTRNNVSSLSNASHSSLPRSLPLRLLSDEDFDSLSAVGLPEDTLDSSQDICSNLSDISIAHESDLLLDSDTSKLSPEVKQIARGSYDCGSYDRGSDRTSSDLKSDGTDVTDVLDIMGDAREYEDVRLTKRDGMLGITLTYGTDTLQGALFVDCIKPGSPAEQSGKPQLHDQILKINSLEVGVDIMCDEAIQLLTDDKPSVTLELARPKKHEVRIRRKVGQSLGMMVAVSKVEDDKSVIISTVDPSGLVAKYGLFKGLTLHKVNNIELTGVGLKHAVEILTGCVGEITLTVFVHPNFSPYQPPRPPTPYPLTDTSEDEVTERSVKFSLPPSPARSNTSAGSLESLPRDPSIGSSPSRPRSEECSRPRSEERSPVRGRSPSSSFDDTRPRVLQPFPRGYGSPSINLINTDWSLDRSLTTDGSFKSLRASYHGNRDVLKGPVRVSHSTIPANILPMPVSLHDSFEASYTTPNKNKHSPTPHPSLNTATPHPSLNTATPHPSLNTATPHPSLNTATPPPSHENLHRSSEVLSEYENLPRYPDYRTRNPPLQRPTPLTPAIRPPSQRSRVVGRSPQNSPAPPSPSPHRPRVLGRRERAAITGDRKVQFGGFRPIDPAGDDEHYV